MKNILTRRQQEILDYLREQDFDPPPTLDELCRALGLSSRGSLHKHISALVEAGLVEPMDGKHRGVLLRDTEAAADEERLPFLGYIAAGRPIEAIPQPETLAVPAALRTHRPCYVLEVRGDSMIEDGILDGDWVVIEQRDQARNGEVVVALVDGGEATLKRIEQKPGQVILHPANGRLAPLRYTPEQVQVQGIL
ncbi:MAG: transcriptional repressor LexA, partial [Gammaproteobacteria bacterium]